MLTTLLAGELRACRNRATRLERLEAEVALRRHDRGGQVDEAGALEGRDRLLGHIELEPVQRVVEGRVAVFVMAVKGGRGNAKLPEIAIEQAALGDLLLLRPTLAAPGGVSLHLDSLDRVGRPAGRTGTATVAAATTTRCAARSEQKRNNAECGPTPHSTQASPRMHARD